MPVSLRQSSGLFLLLGVLCTEGHPQRSASAPSLPVPKAARPWGPTPGLPTHSLGLLDRLCLISHLGEARICCEGACRRSVSG